MDGAKADEKSKKSGADVARIGEDARSLFMDGKPPERDCGEARAVFPIYGVPVQRIPCASLEVKVRGFPSMVLKPYVNYTLIEIVAGTRGLIFIVRS